MTRSLYICCLAPLLAMLLSPGASPVSAQDLGVIQATLLAALPGSSAPTSYRAVAADAQAADEAGDGPRLFQADLYGGSVFRLVGLPLDRSLQVSFLDVDARPVKTVAVRIDAAHNPLNLTVDLSETGRAEAVNAAFAANGQVSHSVALDRYVYMPQDTVHIRYRAENLGQDAVTLTFPSAQRYDFVLQREGSEDVTPVWQWSGDRMFIQTIESLELASGEAVTYKEDLVLPSLALAEGRYVLKGFLTTLAVGGVRSPEMAVTVMVREAASVQVDAQAGNSITVEGVSGGSLSFLVESTAGPLQGKVEVATCPENPAVAIPGYRFVCAADVMPEAALAPLATALKLQVPYDSARLEGLNIRETNLEMFLLNRGLETPAWEAVASDVDPAEGRVSGTVARVGTVGLFAVPGTGLIGDFDADGNVGFTDFLNFVLGYGKQTGDPGFLPELDLDGDSHIAFQDFVIFVAHYGQSLEE